MESLPLQISNFDVDARRRDYYYRQYPFKIIIGSSALERLRYVKDETDFTYVYNTKIRPRISKDVNKYNEFLEIVKLRNKFSAEAAKFVFSGATCTVYATTIETVDEICQSLMKFENSKNIFRIYLYRVDKKQDYDREKIYLQNPKHSLRMYFNSASWSKEDRRKLWKYIKSNDIKPSPSLKRWFNHWDNWNKVYTFSSMFIDLNDEQHITYLSLRFPNLPRKVCVIEKG